MHDLTDHRSASYAIGTVAALSLLLFAAGPAWPQGASPSLGMQSPAQQPAPNPPPAQQQPEPPPPPPREENPGLINELGKLWDKLPKIKTPSETLDDIKGAGASLTKLPSTMVTGRAACAVAANGAPDCKMGADRLCQSMLHVGLDVIRHKARTDDLAMLKCRIALGGLATEAPSDTSLDRSEAFAAAQSVIDSWDDDEDETDLKAAHLRAVARAEFGRRGY